MEFKTCPKCSLRSLEFSGLGEPWYDAKNDRTLVSFKKVGCPMCNWGYENDS